MPMFYLVGIMLDSTAIVVDKIIAYPLGWSWNQ